MPRSILPLALSLFLVACAKDEKGGLTYPDVDECLLQKPAQPIEAPAPYTPRWAFEPWISQDISSSTATREFVEHCQALSLPFGTLLIENPWQTHYNTFVPSDYRYPHFETLITDLQSQDIHVVLWMNPFVNDWYLDTKIGGDFIPDPSPNYETAKQCGYFVDEGKTFSWTGGTGSALDFFNPFALAWWREQQDALLALGIDGWKLDDGESFLRSESLTTYDGIKSHQAYSQEYYRESYAYGAFRTPNAKGFLTLVRAWDQSHGTEGRFFARPEHAPVAWVGEKSRSWKGLSTALDHVFRSAAEGYVVVGTEVGGSLDFDQEAPLNEKLPFDPKVFERWLAVSAWMPFMVFRAKDGVTPWDYPGCHDECAQKHLDTFRFWSTLHKQLAPFFYSLAQKAYHEGGTILYPLGEPSTWPSDYRFWVGDAFLIAPIVDASSARNVALPTDSTFHDFWAPVTDPIAGGTLLENYQAPEKVPVFIKEGAIVPLNVENDVTGLGTVASAGHLTLLLFPGEKESSFLLYENDDTTTEIASQTEGAGVRISLSRVLSPTILRIRTESHSSAVHLAEQPLTEHKSRQAFDTASSGYFQEPTQKLVWIKVPKNPSPIVIQVSS